MAGKIFRYDCYDLRKFKAGDISTFVDIGSNVGTTTLMAKLLNPTARVLSFEPCKETFDILMINMKQWIKAGIECYNVALGDGTDLCFIRRGFSGMHRFCNEKEKQWWPEEERIMIPSKTFPDIFKDYNISTSEPYIIKIDCEGGERFLLRQPEDSLDIIRGSVQTMMEIHIPFGGSGEEWKEWFMKFDNTHELRLGNWEGSEETRRYRYVHSEEFPYTSGKHQVELVNRDWIGPWPGRGM